MNTSYVYVHRTATDGRVFYVGQGVHRRAWSNTGRNPHWHRTVAKYGYEIEIIISGLPKTCALSIERAVISKYGLENLCNITSGGDIGPTGLKHSEAVRKAQSERMKGNSITLGRKLTPEHIEKTRSKLLGRKMSEEGRAKLRARVASAETRAKISAAHKGRKHTPEHRERNAAARRGRKLSDEHKAKLREIGLENARFGADNPAYGVPKTDAQKARLREAMLGRTFKPESIAARSGKNHPRYDPTIYPLFHPEHGENVLDRQDFQEKYGVSSTHFSALIRGKRKSCRGWRLTTR